MKIFFLALTFLLLHTFLIQAQEFDCKVQVLSQRATQTDQAVFQTLRTAIFEFMNNRRWTADKFTQNERIECSFFINITEDPGNNTFRANVTIQASRPVLNSSYNTVLMNHQDEWRFEYVQFQPLEFNENAYTNNLTSLLGFYAYIILGLDYDSFSPKGGTMLFQKAQNVLNNVPVGGGDMAYGWRPNDGLRNRYWLIENILNPKFEVFRDISYEYHRLALDKMHEDVRQPRQTIISNLKKIEPTYTSSPNAMIMQFFFNAKSDELINIFTKAPPAEKNEAATILTRFDPGRTQKYSNLTGGK